ncbi:MAG TPA: MBL fold metallo-hydrolase, partial [Bacillales bacterium]|nr:MBL fold metallo-hydrolase [Bacillales bacterium]
MPIDLGNRIHLIDGFDLKTPGRTGTYVLQEEELTLVETGPSPSVPYVLAGLNDLGLDPAEVKYIIVTHIHLDHAGGAGLLLQHCPNAKVVVHPRGNRHLADPSRLVAGARQVYGEQFDELFDPIVPIPEDRLIVKDDGETLKIGAECTLRFYDSPGHAKHHFSIYDPVSNGIFTGDTAGVRYHQTQDQGLTFYLPSTSPNQFDPEAMLHSIERFRK